ncbi:hypothetical protein DL89DRAFT_258115 [Linderina pennispora]|uniref:LIM zinc-binding domain-containing protein n=1 Tax=Linderina pennispora TaxID=61395 RepID=A0A1Y1W715_9FUNG|nr:uncharacterized protein DL89DRAFT_258115 [Linderina pennispora]ORX69026.1 hypothetical protein DL89DRAFT_258115 [Linderina pennispora]
MYCKRCGDIVYSDRCKRCGGRPVESTTGAAAAQGERRDPWTSTYLERRFHPGSGNPGGSGSSPSARPLSTVYPPAHGNDNNHMYGEPGGLYRKTGSPKSGSPVAIIQAAAVAASSGGDNWRDGIPVPRARGLRDSPAARPASMYATNNTQHSPVQVVAAAQRSAALNGNKPYNISPVLNASSRYSHYKSPSLSSPSMPAAAPMSASPSSSPSKQMKPRWSQYFTSTASPQAAGPSPVVPGARMRSETMPAPYTHEDAHKDLTGMERRHEATGSVYRPSPPPQQQQPKTKQQTIAAAAGVEAAGMAHSQLVDQNTRRLSSGFRTDDGSSHAAANRAPATVEREYRMPTATSLYESPGLSCKTPILPSPITSMPSPRQTSSAFDTRRPVMSSRDNQESRADSGVDTSAHTLRSRSATLPDHHIDMSETRTVYDVREGTAGRRATAVCFKTCRGFCAGCQKIVLTGGRPWVQYGDKVWHKLCIRCRSCNKMLMTPLVDLEGLPICEPCFTKQEPNSTPRFMPKDQAPPAKPASSLADIRPRTQPANAPQIGMAGQKITIPPRPRIEPPIPSAMGGGIGATSPVPTSPTSSTREPIYRGYTSSPTVRSPLSPTPAKVPSTESILTPVLTQYDRAPSHQSLGNGITDVSMVTGKFNEMDAGHDVLERILSPDEIAEKEGLPLPRSIVDPDISAISRSESEATAVSPTPGPRPTSSGSRTSSPQQHRSSPTPPSSKIDAIKTKLNSAMYPQEPAVPSSPRSSLKSPNAPTSRSASRSVSFMVDRPALQPSQLSRQGYEEECDEEEEESEERTTSEDDDGDNEVSDEQSDGAANGESGGSNGTLHDEAENEKSLADYVLSKASGTRKAKSTLPSVADTIKKFSASAFLSESGDGTGTAGRRSKPKRQPTVDKSQLPELRDMIRTHHREPPT